MTEAACFQNLFERHTHPAWVFDARTMEMVAVSDGALELYGLARANFMQQRADALITPQPQPLAQAVAALKPGEPIHQVWHQQNATGKSLVLDVTLQAMRFGHCDAVLVEAREVPRQARMDKALHESRQRLEALTHNHTAAVYFVTPDDRLEWVNARCGDLFDHAAPHELVGRPLGDLFEPRVAEQLVQHHAQVRQQRQTLEFEETHPAMDGPRTYLSVKAPLFDQQGQVSGVCVIATDTTEYKRVAHALQQSEERFHLISQATDDLIWDWDLKSDRVVWNEALEQRLGYWIEELTQSPHWWADRLHPDERDQVVQSVLAAIRGQATSWSAEYRFRCKDQGYATIMDRGLIARDEQGKAYRMIGAMMDITKRKQIELQLQALNDTLAQRVAERTATAEDREAQLRALSADLTHAEQRERRRLAQVLHDHLQQLLVAAKMRLHRLNRPEQPEAGAVTEVEELLQQAIDASRSLTFELYPPILHNAGLAAALEWLARWMHSKYHLNVALDLQPGAEPVQTEMRDLLFQALRELLFNVVKHAHTDQAAVTMSSTDQDHIQITVDDKGVGFVPHAAPSGDPSGFGLLHLQQRLRVLGGQMFIDSTPGQGTHVIMRVPRNTGSYRPAPACPPAAAPAATRDPATPPEPDERSHAIRVLLVDDHKVVREGLVSRLSEPIDIQVIGEACDGETAIRMTRTLSPDVVVMDVWMPGMGGVEATRVIRTEQPWVKVIALSMHDEAHMAKAMIDAGASAYLTKDGSCDVLVKQIRRCVLANATTFETA